MLTRRTFLAAVTLPVVGMGRQHEHFREHRYATAGLRTHAAFDQREAFAPTPIEEVVATLALFPTLKGLRYADLGCGDGRFVDAARRLGADASGIEINCELAEKAAEYYDIDVTCADLFEIALSDLEAVTFSMPPGLRERVLAKLRREAPGAIVVEVGNGLVSL